MMAAPQAAALSARNGSVGVYAAAAHSAAALQGLLPRSSAPHRSTLFCPLSPTHACAYKT